MHSMLSTPDSSYHLHLAAEPSSGSCRQWPAFFDSRRAAHREVHPQLQCYGEMWLLEWDIIGKQAPTFKAERLTAILAFPPVAVSLYQKEKHPGGAGLWRSHTNMRDAGSEEWAVFWQQQISSLGYGAQQLATCLHAKVYVFLTAPRCAHHAACGTGLAAEGCEHIPLFRVPAYPSLHLSGELSWRNEPWHCLPHLGFPMCLWIYFHYKVAVLM